MLNYPHKLDLAQAPTPFYPLDRLRDQLQTVSDHVPRLWIKRDDATGCLTSGNKVRKLEFLLAEAQQSNCSILITSGGIQSNHCRAVAILGAQLGFKVHLILRLDKPPESIGNLFLDQLSGAEITFYTPEEFINLEDLFLHWQQYYQRLGIKTYSIPTGGSNATGLWGYISAAEELENDFKREGIAPTKLIHATGSGGTQAGLLAGFNLLDREMVIKGYAVCDDADYFNKKVSQDIQHWATKYRIDIDVNKLQISTDDSYIGSDYAIAGPEIFNLIKTLAKTEGIILDPVYTGKAFYGMLEDIKLGVYKDDSDIVFLHTGGFFGLLAQQQSLDIQVV